jgi:hypothetical protein
MGTTCCHGEGGQIKTHKEMYWRAEGNLDEGIDCPPESKATRVSNQIEEIKEVHQRFLKCELAQTLDEGSGENYGPYKYSKDNGIYYGQYLAGKREGHGIWISEANHMSYEGIWKNDVMNGPGAQMSPNGDSRVGNLINMTAHGQATFTSADGNLLNPPNPQAPPDTQACTPTASARATAEKPRPMGGHT